MAGGSGKVLSAMGILEEIRVRDQTVDTFIYMDLLVSPIWSRSPYAMAFSKIEFSGHAMDPTAEVKLRVVYCAGVVCLDIIYMCDLLHHSIMPTNDRRLSHYMI
jgi:hypothetical protein